MVGVRGKAVVTSWLMAAMAAGVSAAPPEPGFWLTGVPPGTGGCTVTSLAADGSMAAGGGASSFTWTVAGGRNDYGLLPGMPPINYAMALSDNGVTAGVMRLDGKYDKSRAYRWTGSGPLQDLGVLPGETRSFAWGTSGDGNVIVGHAEHGKDSYFTGQAFRWTPTGGMQGLGYLVPGSLFSQANSVSRDGTTIVGVSRVALDDQPFVWTESNGMKALPGLPNAIQVAAARAVNSDGSTVAGSASSAVGKTHAVRWTLSGIEDLVSPTFSGNHSLALALSDDGSLIGGSVSQSGQSLAFLWTESLGMVSATDFLSLYGVDVPSGYKLEYVFSISGDGLTFGGQALNLTTNLREGFVATVPAPGIAGVVAISWLLNARRRRE